MRFFLIALLCSTFTLSAYAVPYQIPEPTPSLFTNYGIFDELSEKLGDGTLHTEDDLLSSLDFVQECEAFRYQRRNQSY